MNSRWLIRTQSNHILGPISRDKLVELLESNSLSLNDELCSGNGHWFSVHEEKLLKNYVYDDMDQGFNEVSEALNEFRKRELEARQKGLAEDREDTKVVNLADLEDIQSPDFVAGTEKKN